MRAVLRTEHGAVSAPSLAVWWSGGTAQRCCAMETNSLPGFCVTRHTFNSDKQVRTVKIALYRIGRDISFLEYQASFNIDSRRLCSWRSNRSMGPTKIIADREAGRSSKHTCQRGHGDRLSHVRLLLLLTVGFTRQPVAHHETYKAMSFGKGRQNI